MDFAFFESLNKDKAQLFLQNFLVKEHEAVNEMITTARQQGIDADFSVASLPILLRWVVGRLETVPTQPDESLPEWIRKTDSYPKGLFEFTEPSKIRILRAAYYLGETFVRNFSRLTWATGNRNTALQNMPVVTGFKEGVEMAPLLVVENIFKRVLSGGASEDAIEVAVQTWIGALLEEG